MEIRLSGLLGLSLVGIMLSWYSCSYFILGLLKEKNVYEQIPKQKIEVENPRWCISLIYFLLLSVYVYSVLVKNKGFNIGLKSVPTVGI